MEFKLTAANRAFVLLTILGPLLIVALSVLPGLLAARGGQGSARLSIAFANADQRFLDGVEPALLRAGIRVVDVQASPQAMEGLVKEGALDGYIVLPDHLETATRLEYVSRGAVDFRIISALESAVGKSVVALRLEDAGFPAEKIASLLEPPTIETRQLGGAGSADGRDFLMLLFTAVSLVLLLYFSIQLYGQATGRAVLMERTSRTVEILLSSVKPLDILYGKILGKALAAMLQYAVWVLMTAGFLAAFGGRLGVALNLAITPATLLYLVLFFLLGFLLFSSLYAALGSAAQDEQHLSQLGWPVVIFLLVPVVMITPIIMNPAAPLAVALSLFPLTAPVVMFLRIVMGAVPSWQIALCIALLAATIALVAFLSAKIFRVGILMTGKRFRLAEIARWVRS